MRVFLEFGYYWRASLIGRFTVFVERSQFMKQILLSLLQLRPVIALSEYVAGISFIKCLSVKTWGQRSQCIGLLTYPIQFCTSERRTAVLQKRSFVFKIMLV